MRPPELTSMNSPLKATRKLARNPALKEIKSLLVNKRKKDGTADYFVPMDAFFIFGEKIWMIWIQFLFKQMNA